MDCHSSYTGIHKYLHPTGAEVLVKYGSVDISYKILFLTSNNMNIFLNSNR